MSELDIKLMDKKRGVSLHTYVDISTEGYLVFDIDEFFVVLDKGQCEELHTFIGNMLSEGVKDE